MNIKYICIGISLLIFIHLTLYVFNIDLLDSLDKRDNNVEIGNSINTLTQSLEELKEIS
jgi:hypothetical protein